MSLKVFLELIEIKAKTASLFPFLMGILFSFYYYHSFNLLTTIVFLIAALLFNMAVDVLDNYNDYRHARDIEGYQQQTNIIGREHLSLSLVLGLIVILVGSATLLGVYLVYLTNWAVLWMGIIAFFIGIFYSSGPLPLSSLPVGEVAAGLSMGFLITLISVYINSFLVFTWDWNTILGIFLVALPNILWISNLMLANNTCDYQEDIDNGRHTLSYFLGQKRSVTLFKIKNVLAILVVFLTIYFKFAPWTVSFLILLLPFVIKKARQFSAQTIKAVSFKYAVKILAVGSLTYFILYFIGILI